MIARRTKAKKRRRALQPCHRATINLTERTKNSRKHDRKITLSTQRTQKRAQRGHARRGQGTWPGMQQEQLTSSRMIKKKKMRKGIASSRQRTPSGGVTAGQNRAQQGHTRKGRGTWPGMQRGWQTIPRRMKNKKTRQGIANSRRETLSGEVTAGETKMRQRWPQARWGFPEERQEDLQNRQLRCHHSAIHKVQ